MVGGKYHRFSMGFFDTERSSRARPWWSRRIVYSFCLSSTNRYTQIGCVGTGGSPGTGAGGSFGTPGSVGLLGTGIGGSSTGGSRGLGGCSSGALSGLGGSIGGISEGGAAGTLLGGSSVGNASGFGGYGFAGCGLAGRSCTGLAGIGGWRGSMFAIPAVRESVRAIREYGNLRTGSEPLAQRDTAFG
jgi:hypothetical protein